MLGRVDGAGQLTRGDRGPVDRVLERLAHLHLGERAALVRAQMAGLHGTGRDAAIAELAPELDNLQTTWRYFVAAREVHVLSGLLDGLWMVHDQRVGGLLGVQLQLIRESDADA